MNNFSHNRMHDKGAGSPGGFGRGFWRTHRLALCLCLSLGSAHADTPDTDISPDIRVVFSGQTKPYEAFRHGFEEGLAGHILSQTRFYADVDSLDPASLNRNSIIVSIGTAATRWALANTDQPMMAGMIPADSFHRFREDNPDRRLTGMFIDQPPARHMALIRVLLPEAEHAALFAAGIDESQQSTLLDAASAVGLDLHIRQANSRSDIIRAVRELRTRMDAFLILPGGATMSAASLRALLLHGFHEQIPVFGYSPGLVTAGSLAAVHSDPRELGSESAEQLQQLVTGPGSAWPPGRYPSNFRISSNRELARSLQLRLPSDDTLRERIQALEADNAP